MKIYLKFLFSLLLFCFANLSYAEPETFTIDPSHSFVEWSISHVGYSHPSGKWFVNGTLVLDKDKPENDKVNVTININDFVTGIPKLDEHLKKEVFFNTEKYPTATFISTKVVKTGKDTANITGDLTLRGVTKPVVLKAKLNKAAVSELTNKFTVGFSATATVKRSEFGITGFTNILGEDVPLTIEVEANK